MNETTLTLGVAALAFLLTSPSGWAAENRTNPAEIEKYDWDRMENRLRQVEEELAAGKAARGASLLDNLRRQVGIDGLVEIEAFSSKDYADEDESDLTLATVELALHAQLNDWTNTHILFLWEEDATEPVEVDEAGISLGNPEKFPLFLNAGKLYVPFGMYASYLIQDPLTLELGETRETMVQIGAEQAGFSGSIFAFNGDLDETGSDNEVDSFGASLGYAATWDRGGLHAGVDYLSNLADSDTFTAVLHDDLGISTIEDRVAGAGVHLHLTWEQFTFYSEYIGALDEFAAGELAFRNRGAKPRAYHLEAAYTSELAGRPTTFSLAYQATDEALDLGLPEERYSAGLTAALTDFLFWSLEYSHDEDYSIEDNGTGGDADQVITQLAVEF